jgi:hypothetical protein
LNHPEFQFDVHSYDTRDNETMEHGIAATVEWIKMQMAKSVPHDIIIKSVATKIGQDMAKGSVHAPMPESGIQYLLTVNAHLLYHLANHHFRSPN